MNNKKRAIIIIFLVSALIMLSSCKSSSSGDDSSENFRTGTQGLVLSFIPNSPPAELILGKTETQDIGITIEARNKGAHPENGILEGKIWLSGFDSRIISLKGANTVASLSSKGTNLNGKSYVNPNGGYDIFEFEAQVHGSSIGTDSYDTQILATSCYSYATVASGNICIDKDPYTTTKEKKVCSVSPLSMSSQGAPVAVTKIEPQVLGDTIQFNIEIENSGTGDVLALETSNSDFQKCDPYTESRQSRLDRKDFDLVYVENGPYGPPTVAGSTLTCRPTTQGTGSLNYIRLVNGKGFMICTVNKNSFSDSGTAFITPIKIPLYYVYRQTAQKPFSIKVIPN